MRGSNSMARLVALALVTGLVHFHAQARTLTLEAPQFSADLVRTNAAGEQQENTGKLYVAGDNIRIETPDFPGNYFLIDLGARTSYFVQPAQRLIMDARRSSPLPLVFVPVDPGNPCPQWQSQSQSATVGAVAGEALWRCEREGEETVGGRRAIKIRVEPAQRHLHFAWIDPELRMPIRMQAAFGTAELANVRIGPPPAELFKVPYEFRKFDPLHLIEQIKQSDVWVEPPP
jgi:hypothetical protein